MKPCERIVDRFSCHVHSTRSRKQQLTHGEGEIDDDERPLRPEDVELEAEDNHEEDGAAVKREDKN